MSIFIGSGTAVCTPFNENGSFNPTAYEKLIHFQVENGTDAIITCGTTGEISTLYFNEHVEVARTAVETVKSSSRKIPVIAGAGGNDTRHIIELGKELQLAGVDALMLVTPYYNKTSQRGLIEHFSMIASSIDLPIVLYNVPSRTSLNMLPKTVAQLSKIDNIVAVKEAGGDIVQIAQVIELCGSNIDVYSGNDDHVVPILSLGGIGVISTIANIAPQQMHDLVLKYLEGDVKGSAKMQLEMLGLVRSLFADVNPMPVKEALNLLGFEMGSCRRPLTCIDNDLKDELILQMRGYGLL
ncbi:MAG: 4-hydroxy-tetrahydrodipicolinate synthase [Defluviitaleaceae bacterium]|nr:4-hydroxy-tetrahydrodipicolinate synthase [Defluviitaleaceae bacterium]